MIHLEYLKVLILKFFLSSMHERKRQWSILPKWHGEVTNNLFPEYIFSLTLPALRSSKNDKVIAYKWKRPINPETQNKINALNLKQPIPEIWAFDPFAPR